MTDAPQPATPPWTVLPPEPDRGAGLGVGVRVLVVSDGTPAPGSDAAADGHTERVAELCRQMAGRAEIGYASAAQLKTRTLAADLRAVVTADGWRLSLSPPRCVWQPPRCRPHTAGSAS